MTEKPEDASPLAKFDAPVLRSIEATEHEAGVPRAMFLPTSYGEAMEIAKTMAASIAVPKFLRGKPADCLSVLLQASRWGLDPFAVAGKCYFVNDAIAFEAQLVDAVLNNSKVLNGRLRVTWQGEGTGLRCTVTGTTKSDPDNVMTKTQSIARITVRNSPLWTSDPEQQLAYYTKRAWARLYVPEVIMGVYTPDELQTAEPVRSAIPAPRRGDTVIDAVAQETTEIGPDQWTDDEWRSWGMDVIAERQTAASEEQLHALMAKHQPTLDAAPPSIRNSINNHSVDFTDIDDFGDDGEMSE